jgi:hypothetical protein
MQKEVRKQWILGKEFVAAQEIVMAGVSGRSDGHNLRQG